MATTVPPAGESDMPPNHNQLPDRDGTFAASSQEAPQSRMLSSALEPLLRRRHPDGQYFLSEDVGIYFRCTNPPLLGVKAPDWFYVPNVPPLWEGEMRRSYVLWQESLAPLIVLEYASDDGLEERDQTPHTGKFWVYERAIRVPYYGIYEAKPGQVELYCLVGGRYQRVPPNARGRYPIPPLDVELGIWRGKYLQYDLPWLRWWDAQGELLLATEERVEQERVRADLAKQRADTAREQTDQKKWVQRMEEKLRELGVDPDTLGQAREG